MSLHRHNAKRDTAEAAIVDYLRHAGCLVTRLSATNLPDLLVRLPSRVLVLVEIKTGKKKLQPGQVEFAATWDGSVFTVRSIEGAQQFMAAARQAG